MCIKTKFHNIIIYKLIQGLLIKFVCFVKPLATKAFCGRDCSGSLPKWLAIFGWRGRATAGSSCHDIAKNARHEATISEKPYKPPQKMFFMNKPGIQL